MIFSLQFKTPDVTDQVVMNHWPEKDREKAKELIKQYLKWGEYILVEFNTETSEVKVCKQ